MIMTNKSKYFKNPQRGQDKPVQPYIPQWQVWGREPVEAGTPSVHKPFVARTNKPKRPLSPLGQNVPFADERLGNLGHARLPNVGNNVENTWASMDGMTIDEDGEASIEENQMLDNNNDDPRNYKNIPAVLTEAPPPLLQTEHLAEKSEVKEFAKSNDEYLLLIHGDMVSSGSFEAIQDEVQALLFDEHPLNQMYNITADDIVVLKRVKIKVGVFLE